MKKCLILFISIFLTANIALADNGDKNSVAGLLATKYQVIGAITRLSKAYNMPNDLLPLAIGYCEGNLSQNSIHINKDGSRDIGVFQISEKYNGARAKTLGHDIYTLEGNLSYGFFLLVSEGISHWNASKKCIGSFSPSKISLGIG